MLCTSGGALAQDAADDEPGTADPAQPPDATVSEDRLSADYGVDIIVTAQKREENLQDVPMAITAITTKKLDELQVSDFDAYARYLPSVSYQTAGPGYSNVYFRGVARRAEERRVGEELVRKCRDLGSPTQ